MGQNTNASTTLSATPPTNVSLFAQLHGGADCSQFSLVLPTGTFTVDSSNSQTVVIKFSPTSPGNKTCKLDLKDSPTNVFRSFDVNGKGIAPQIAITTPTPPGRTLAFGHVDLGFTSNAMQVVAKNNGDSTLNISSASITSDTAHFLVLTGPSNVTVPPTMSAIWDIVCQPSAKGPLTGNFRIMSDTFATSDKALDITLECTGDQASLATSMTSINFGNVQRGTTQMATFMLTNSGNVPVTNITSMIGNAGRGYTFATNPPTTVAANNSEMITIVFNPLNAGHGGPTSVSFSGSWGNSRSAAPQPVGLNGQEASFSITNAPIGLDFGSFRFDAHEPRTFQIVNDGNAPLLITAPFTANTGTLATEYKIDLVKGGAVLSPPVSTTANDQITVTVTPQVNHRLGLVEGHIDVTSNAIGSVTERIPITGIATAANLNVPTSIEFGTVDITAPTTTQIITIQNTGNDTLDITSVSTMAENSAFQFKLPATPAHINANSSLEIPVTYSPTKATAPETPDTTILSIEIGGSLSATATVMITGEAVFTEVYGSGGCRAGNAASRPGTLLIGLAMLGLLRRRRSSAGRSLLAKPTDDSVPIIARGLLHRLHPVTSPTAISIPPPQQQENTHRSKSTIALIGLAIAAALASHVITTAARADGIGLTVFEPTPATTGTSFALQAPDVGTDGNWVASAVASYASNPLIAATVTGAGRTTHLLVERSTLMQLGAAYALRDRFELGAHLPLYQQSGEGPQSASGTARGNLALHAKARLWRGDPGPGAITLGASLVGVLPTASKGQFTGSDRPAVRLLGLGAFTPAVLDARLVLSINAGPVLRGQSQYANIVEKSGATWGAGASFRILDALWATGELFGTATPSARRPPPMTGALPSPVVLSPIEWLAGVRFQPERRVSVGVAFGRGLTAAAGTPDLRGVLSLSISPGAAPIAPIHPHTQPEPERDTDGDGIVDRLDRCPREPEDKDGFEDSDGCPDPDNDRDGIADVADRCPNVPETVNGIDDQDGCPEAPEAAAPDPAKLKEAEDTFTHGRELMQQGKFAEACAELSRSQALDPQFGTQYNLAGCYAKLGNLASAWKLYREVAQSDTNATRRERAAAQVAALAGRTPKLKLVLPRKPDGAQISLNGADASALIDSETPVDPGNYDVAVEAAGFRAWRKTVAVTQEGKVVTVVIQLQPAK